MEKRVIIFHLILIFIISLSADLLYINNYGFYSDDWGMSQESIFSDNKTFVQLIKDTLIRQWEMRPLRAIEYASKRITFAIGGLCTVYLFQSLVITLSMMLFYLILIKRIPKTHALVISLIFSLSPLDTTTLWLAAMNYRFSLLCCLIAIYLLVSGKKAIYSALLLISSLLFCEAPFGLFLITPLLMIDFSNNGKFNKKLFYSFVKKTVIIFFFVLAIYLLWRLMIAPLYMEDMRVNKMIAGGIIGIIKNHLNSFISGYRVLLLSSVKFLLLSLRSEISVFIFTICILNIVSFVYLKYQKKREIIHYGIMLQDTEKQNSNILRSWYYIIYYTTLGLITILFSNWLGLSSIYNEVVGVGTRFNFVAGIAFSFFSFGMILFLFKIIDYFVKSNKLILFEKTFLIVLILSLLATHRVHIQKDYAESWKIQKNILTGLLEFNPFLVENSLILLEYTDHKFRAMPVFNIHTPWQIHYMGEFICGANRTLFLEDYIKEINMNGELIHVKAWHEGSSWLYDHSVHPEQIFVFSATMDGKISREDSLKFAAKNIRIKVNTSSFESYKHFTGNKKILSLLGISKKEYQNN